MKTWQELKDTYAREHGYDDWNEILYSTDDPNELDIHIDTVSLLRAKEVARESLKNASKRATVEYGCQCAMAWVDKESITNENNIPL